MEKTSDSSRRAQGCSSAHCKLEQLAFNHKGYSTQMVVVLSPLHLRPPPLPFLLATAISNAFFSS